MSVFEKAIRLCLEIIMACEAVCSAEATWWRTGDGVANIINCIESYADWSFQGIC
jgi:hypothetical protein